MAQELPEGTVTIVFTDVVGSTAMTNRLGDQRGRELMREVEEIVRGRVEHHRGVEVKGLGDGQMVAFTSARRAVLCAVDIQKGLDRWRRSGDRDGLALRIGLHAGATRSGGRELISPNAPDVKQWPPGAPLMVRPCNKEGRNDSRFTRGAIRKTAPGLPGVHPGAPAARPTAGVRCRPPQPALGGRPGHWAARRRGPASPEP